MLKICRNQQKERIKCWMETRFLTRILISHTSLAFMYGIFLVLYELKFFREVIPEIHPLLIAWAGCVTAYDIWIRQIWRKIPCWKPLALFVFFAGVTAVLNFETGLVVNIKGWILAILPLFAFLPTCLLARKDKRTTSFLTSLLGGAVVACLASMVSLVMYVNRVAETVTICGVTDTVGIRYYFPNDPTSAVLLYGIYTDTNHAALYSLVLIVYGIVLLLACIRGEYTQKWKNVMGGCFAVVSILVQSCYFPLANSRGAWLAMGIALFLSVFVFLYSQVIGKGGTARRCVVSLAVACIILVAVCGGFLGIRASMATLASELGFNDSTEVIEGAAEKDLFEKTNEEFGAGRITIWKDALKLVGSKPIFGHGSGNISFYSKIYSPDGVIAAGKVDVHNSYLDLLLAYGVVGFIFLMGFFVVGIIRGLVQLIITKHKCDVCFFLSTAVVIIIACGSCLLSCAFINTTAMYFFMLMATSYSLAEYENKAARL